jgi:myo-inositol-hexaphosphate 3-phosphohydrolase
VLSEKFVLNKTKNHNPPFKLNGRFLMAFHPDKRNIFRVTTKKSPQHFYYNMHGHILESVQSAKYLGVKLSADLNWNNHIQQMTSKANKSLSFIRRNLQIYSKSVKDRAYQCLVRPKLGYCCSVGDPYTPRKNYKIEQVQRRAARYACHRHQ